MKIGSRRILRETQIYVYLGELPAQNKKILDSKSIVHIG
jgi:hypothetical protein